MKALKRNGLAGGMAALLAVAVLGLFSLSGCFTSAPYVSNPVDVAPGSEEDPFAGTEWEFEVPETNRPEETMTFEFFKDGTVSVQRTKPKQYTVVVGDDGSYMVNPKGFLIWLTIDTFGATEGDIKMQTYDADYDTLVLHLSATKK